MLDSPPEHRGGVTFGRVYPVSSVHELSEPRRQFMYVHCRRRVLLKPFYQRTRYKGTFRIVDLREEIELDGSALSNAKSSSPGAVEEGRGTVSRRSLSTFQETDW